MKTTPTVYVCQRPKANNNGWAPNISPADKYGKLQYVFESNEGVFRDTSTAVQTAADGLKGFNPETDYILSPPTTDPASLWVVLMVLGGHFGVKKVNFLYWERGFEDGGERSSKVGTYIPTLVDVTKLID